MKERHEDIYEYDDITGKPHKKMGVLNKKDLSRQDMDDLFLDEGMVFCAD